MTVKLPHALQPTPLRPSTSSPSSPSSSSRAPPRPWLLALRVLCGLHALVAALHPTGTLSTTLSTTAPLQLSFLLFLSGFTLTLLSVTSAQPFPSSPPSFYLRRLATILPPHCVALFLHALLFSTSSSPFRRALFSSLALSPYVPPSLTFPPHDAAFPLPNLLPALALCYLVFPTVLELLPRFNTPHPRHLTLALLAVYAVTAINAVWLSTLSDSRAPTLPDVVAFVPFLALFPPFLLGVIVALIHKSHPVTPASLPARVARLSGSLILLLLALAVAAALLLALPPTSFLSIWTTTGLFLPPLALAADAAAAMSDQSLIPSSSPVARLVKAAARAELSIYCFAPLALRVLSASLCSSSAPATQRARFCLPFSRVHIPSAFATAPAAAAHRLLTAVTFASPLMRALPAVPIAVAIALALHGALVAPVTTFLCRLVNRTSHQSRTRSATVQRDEGNMSRFAKAILYYFCAIAFLVGVFRLSLPFTTHLVQSPPNVFCAFLPFLEECLRRTHVSLVKRIVGVLRWLALLTLPPMLFNLFGHLAFPRSMWRRLPCVADMLSGAVNTSQVMEDGGATSKSVSLTTRTTRTTSTMHVPSAEVKPNLPGVTLSNCGQSIEQENLCMDFVLYIRYVTRGTSPRLVTLNARRAANTLIAAGLPRHLWRVEIVSDRSVGLARVGGPSAVYEIVVPDKYHTTTGALYKARALNYAIDASPAREHDWIVHLDEETRFDTDTVRAILYHCGKESFDWSIAKRTKWPCIGQGPILYGRFCAQGQDDEDVDGVGRNWVTTLADSGRVADDMGRYRVQYECGEVWVGMHGSFVVVCNAVERSVTFDHGLEGSIAEDAFFALVARAQGVRFAWVDGLMFEQSPFTVGDFVKQRARWLVGGMRVVGCGRLPWRVRWVMLILTGIWALMPVIYMALVGTLVSGGGVGAGEGYFQLLTATLATVSIWNYVMGFFVTFRPGETGAVRLLVLLYAQLALSPVFGVMEVMAVSYGLWNFRKVAVGFHVVQKDVQQSSEVDVSEKRSGMEEAICDEGTPLLSTR